MQERHFNFQTINEYSLEATAYICIFQAMMAINGLNTNTFKLESFINQ